MHSQTLKRSQEFLACQDTVTSCLSVGHVEHVSSPEGKRSTLDKDEVDLV